jgi:inner membrane protein involved in colicin E2 resistance
LQQSAFGFDLYIPADHYQMAERTVKYALLFVSLTFLVFFFIEVLNNRYVHPFQYILIGLALCIFYTLLLSISEQLGFTPAYYDHWLGGFLQSVNFEKQSAQSYVGRHTGGTLWFHFCDFANGSL